MALDWQPVSTAPKDGRWFLTYSAGQGGPDSYPAFDFAQWDEQSGGFGKWGCGFDYVTHWADVPEPPEGHLPPSM